MAGQMKFLEAEPLLIEGYEGMRARKHLMRNNHWLTEGLKGIISFYEASGKPELAAKWKVKLAALHSE